MVKVLDPLAGTNLYGIYAFDGKAWFQGDFDWDNHSEQWVSDGTPEGTHVFEGSGDLLRIGFPTFDPTISTVGVPIVVGGVTYFAGTDLAHGTELWKSVDGTLASAQFLADTDPRTNDECGCPVSGWPQNLTAGGNGRLFFTAGYTFDQTPDNEANIELWKSNGTALGTKRVKEIGIGVVGSKPTDLTTFKNGVAFVTEQTPSPKGLWKSNGKSRGTKAIVAAPWREVVHAYPYGLAKVNGILIFVAAVDGDPFEIENELWRSDGTSAGTELVMDINPDGSSRPELLIEVGSAAFFTADDGTHGRELWRYVP